MDESSYSSLSVELLQQEFLKSFQGIDPVTSLHSLINSMPYAAAILTADRRAIFTNQSLLKQFGFSSIEELLGKRPGEILNCLHAVNNNNICGVSENCKVCGAMNALNKSLLSHKRVAAEMHLTVVKDGSNVSHDMQITVSPLPANGNVYLVLYLNDISHEKRRKAIERIFFHDVLNKISSLNGLYELLIKDTDETNRNEYMDLIGLILSDLTDEIIAQRQLVAAEAGEIVVKWEDVLLAKLLDRVIMQVKQFSNPKDIKIEYVSQNNGIIVTTDRVLLNRIVTNLLKNAIEASEPHQNIQLISSVSDNSLTISVSNQSYIPSEIQLQIFQRSFSTKGENRGLGTYSIKLLTERYLGGKVCFTSTPEKGTTFIVALPCGPIS